MPRPGPKSPRFIATVSLPGGDDGRPDARDDDAAAFAQAVLGVHRLGGVARVSPLPAKAASPAGPVVVASGRRVTAAGRGSTAGVNARVASVQGRAARAGAAPSAGVGGAAARGPRVLEESAGEAQWAACANGVDRRVLRRLRSGETTVDGRLDLHGLTRHRAVETLDRFLAAARAGGRRCLVIVHGRGLHSGPQGPALREAARATLVDGPNAGAVLACCAAPPAWGGAGATLVLLRR